MDHESLKEIALANLPSQKCPLSGHDIDDPAILHRDLSDWFPSDLQDLWDNRLSNIMIVNRSARDAYYKSLKAKSIVIAFSGGLDSTTVLHWAIKLFSKVHCLIFDYGQRHSIEILKAESYLGLIDDYKSRNDCEVTSKTISLDCINTLADSSLTRDYEPQRNQDLDEIGSEIPNTFVPGRNVYFITALAQTAFRINARHIGMGVNVLDYSGYPDCRPEFIVKMREALSIGIFNGHDIGVHAPLMNLDKKQIIRLGRHLGVKYEDTHSCYMGVEGGCGECDSCLLRRKAFNDLGIEDPSVEKYYGK